MQAPAEQQPVAQQVMGAVGGAAPMAARPAAMMSPIDAIKSCIAGSLSFEGRASRSEFWWFVLFYSIVDMGLRMAVMAAEIPMLGMVILLLIPAALSVSARRLHDHGKSGWFMLIPFYNLYLFIIDGDGEVGQYGAPPTNVL